MKILAIRGRNLTALAGDFEIVLDRAPLAGAGLFALTGPTGAGKTTLLDALCLALYDRTPRLGSRTAVKVAAGSEGEALSAQDPRHLLRRGCGEGFAEVEFLGRDGARYRARWSVWRTRNDPAGKLQFAELELRSADGGLVVGGRKTDVLEAIEKRIGLNFEQFTRSVLLAQGDFAAFLRAPAKERAELLERMTGTVLFREISIAAYQRMAAAVQKRDEIARDRDATPRLDAEARAKVENECATAVQRIVSGQDNLAAAQNMVAWHVQAAQKRRDVELATDAWTFSGLEKAKLADLSRQAAQVGRVQALRGGFEASVQAKKALDHAKNQVLHHENRHAEAQDHQNQARAACVHAENHLLQLQNAFRALQPHLKAARALEVQHAAALQAEFRSAEELKERVREHEKALNQGHRTLEEVQTRLEALSVLEKTRSDAATERLAQDWPRWEAALQRHLGLLREQEQFQNALHQALRAFQAASEGLGLLAERTAQADREVIAAEEALNAARAAVEAVPLTGLQAARSQLQQRIERFGQLEPIVHQAHALGRERLQLQNDLVGAKTAIEQAQAEAGQASQALGALQIRLEEASGALRAVQTRLSLAEHRAALRDGEPCPLCGACEHPFSGSALGEGLVRDAEGRVEELQQAIEQERDAFLRASTRNAAASQRVRELQGRLTALDGQLAELQVRHAALGESGSPWDAGAQEALGRLTHAIEVEKGALQRREQAHEQAQANLEHARTALQALSARREALRAEEGQRHTEIERARTAETTAQRDLQRIESELQAARPGLTAVLGDGPWETALLGQEQTFVAARGRAVKAFLAWTAAFTAENDRLTAARQAHEAALRAIDALWPQVERAQVAHRALVQAREAIEAQRAQFCGGKSADAVEDEHANAVSEAEAHCRGRREALERHHQEASGLAEALQAAKTLVHERETLHLQHAAALEEARSALGLTADELAGLLAHTPEWLAQARATCEAADAAVAKAETVLAERNAQLEAHAAARPAALDPAQAAAQVEELTREVQTLAARRATLQHQLAVDDAAAQRFQERSLQHQQAAAEAAVWERLSELIGSADGAKFQKFAQGLTLELLLDQANLHLQELAPRYLLQRIPNSELELQVVDREMGDEIRAVASLSGGESFLASLALALGLSALAARETAVDSLFIDEGFGTLDPETLDVALAALDNLQAQGRQVGLISHVAGLAERVGAQVRVVKRGSGRSEVQVVGLEPAGAPALNPLRVPAAPRKRKPRARAPAE